MNSPKKVVLVGLGGIGFRYEIENTSLTEITQLHNSQTHYSAALQNSHKIIGGVDLDPLARQVFENFTSIKTWQSINKIKNLKEVDILVISTPTGNHLEQFQLACEELKPRAILCEKPFGQSAQESEQMIEISRRLHIPIMVNYSRNFSHGFKIINQIITEEGFKSGHVLYAQGLRENGSHFLRLIIELFGAPINIFFDGERSSSRNPSFTLHFANSKRIRFSGSDTDNIRLGEIFLETNSSAIKIAGGMGFEIRQIDKVSKPVPWFGDFTLKHQGNLSGGLNELYRDTKWASAESLDLCIQGNYLDLACNRVMDEVLPA